MYYKAEGICRGWTWLPPLVAGTVAGLVKSYDSLMLSLLGQHVVGQMWSPLRTSGTLPICGENLSPKGERAWIQEASPRSASVSSRNVMEGRPLAMREKVVWEPVMCRRRYWWRKKLFFPQEERAKKVRTSFVGIRKQLWRDFLYFLLRHWLPVWSPPMKSNMWHHLGKILVCLRRRTRVYHSFILSFPQHVTGCINSDMILVWPGL